MQDTVDSTSEKKSAAKKAAPKKRSTKVSTRTSGKRAQALPAILRSIKNEHRYMHTLIDLLEEQLDKLRDKKPADFNLMYDIMHYMNHFPDRFHHPKEDMMLERMLSRDPVAVSMVEGIRDEHQELAEKGQLAFDIIRSAIRSYSISKKHQIIEVMHDYTSTLRSHMAEEEKVLLPRAMNLLAQSDWDAVAAKYAVYEDSDPIFGERMGEEYPSVYQRLGSKFRQTSRDMSLTRFVTSGAIIESAAPIRQGLKDIGGIIKTQSLLAFDKQKEHYKGFVNRSARANVDSWSKPADALLDTFDCYVDGLVEIAKVMRTTQEQLDENLQEHRKLLAQFRTRSR